MCDQQKSDARRPIGEVLHNRLRAASVPTKINLLVKPGWLKLGVVIDVDGRKSLYG